MCHRWPWKRLRFELGSCILWLIYRKAPTSDVTCAYQGMHVFKATSNTTMCILARVPVS